MSVTFYPNYIHNVGFDAAAEPSVTTQNYVSSGGETAGAAYDLVDSNRDNLLTVDTDGEATDFTIDLDLTANITSCDFAILDNINIDLAGADFKLTHGAADITCSAYQIILGDGNGGDLMGAVSTWYLNDEWNVAGEDIALLLFSGISDNNWEWNFRDFEGGNFSADITIGEIIIGKKFATNYQPEIGIIKSSNFGTGILQSKGGHKYGFKNYGETRRWQLNWIFINDAEKALFETLWAVTEGMRYPFYIDLGENSNPTLYFVRFAMPELQFTEVPGAWKLNMIIEEEV